MLVPVLVSAIMHSKCLPKVPIHSVVLGRLKIRADLIKAVMLLFSVRVRTF